MRISILVVLALAFAVPARADLVLETETGRLGKKGTGTVGNALELTRESDGTIGVATLTAIEFAPFDQWELLIEPFFWDMTIPGDGSKITGGPADLEITVSYFAFVETQFLPAIVLAMKVKVPGGHNPDVSTGQADFTTYLILAKNIGGWDFNVNIAPEYFGSPAGQTLYPQMILDLSVDRYVTDRLSIYGEVFGNTAPDKSTNGTIVGSIAAEWDWTPHIQSFCAVRYDTDQIFTVQPGFNFVW